MWGKNKKRVSVRDVQAAAPAESQEEARVMEYIERNDDTGSSSQHLDQRSAAFLELNREEATGEKTVEDDLFAYTNSINRLHHKMRDKPSALSSKGASSYLPAQIFRDKENQANTDTDAFAANAGKLFHRFQKKRGKKSLTEDKGDEEIGEGSRKTKKGKRKKNTESLQPLREFQEMIMSNRSYTYSYIKNALCFFIIPSVCVACLLYYGLDNPGLEEIDLSAIPSQVSPKRNTTNQVGDDFLYIGGFYGASYSYLTLFLFARQVITFGVARGLQFVLVSVAMRNPDFGVLGPLGKLFLLQARGWPLQFFLWGILDFIVLYGEGDFKIHWLYWQEYMDVFNKSNPGGELTVHPTYRGILIFAICAGVLTALKRFVIGLVFGKTSYHRYAEKLSTLLGQILLVSKVAKSAMLQSLDITQVRKVETLQEWQRAGEIIEETSGEDSPGDIMNDMSLGSTRSESKILTESQVIKVAELLDVWEEPEICDTTVEDPSLSSIVQFRASMGILVSDMPFSQAFGMSKTRAQVIDGAQNLYIKLVKKQIAMQNMDDTEDDHASTMLRFHTIALTALKKDGSFDENMAKDLVTMFRPARDGDIRLIEFCKSIDSLYKEMRKLKASISSESRMNAASETCINVLYYFILICVGVAVIGIDPLALFGFMTSFILGFSFMISGASSDYFRGLLFILLQRPYDIGDRIAVASPQTDASGGGSAGWIVKDVTLYHTTVIYGTTQEYATFSNGTLAGSRIINAARSPRATLNFVMKFGLKVPSKTIQDFKEDLIEHVKSKPREWLSFCAFRMTRVEADLGFVEYKIVLQHRESWQQVGGLLTSLADVQAYAFEKSKEMKMDYKSPSLPVEMRMTQATPEATTPLNNMSTALNSMFGGT